MAIIIDGKQIVHTLLPQLKERVAEITERLQRPPRLGIILVGPTESSRRFTDIKIKMAEQVGIKAERIPYPDTITEEQLENEIARIVARASLRYDVFIFQWPPPRHIDPKVLHALPDDRDVDRMALCATDRLANGRETLAPPIVQAFQKILNQPDVRAVLPQVRGVPAVVVGAGGGGALFKEKEWGRVGGFPIFQWLSQMGAEVRQCHKGWRAESIAKAVQEADIVFSAVGKEGFEIPADWIKPGAVVVDGAYFYDNALGCKRGDIVDTEKAAERAAVFAASPGGIGQLTVYYVLDNTDHLVRRQLSII
jgi:methylenetetrahydrofolate dehydrogenase (NADP+) / methenyltetrahydrofolate cyclohydrolase